MRVKNEGSKLKKVHGFSGEIKKGLFSELVPHWYEWSFCGLKIHHAKDDGYFERTPEKVTCKKCRVIMEKQNERKYAKVHNRIKQQ